MKAQQSTQTKQGNFSAPTAVSLSMLRPAVAALLCLSTIANAQAPVVLPADTPVMVELTQAITPSKLHPGDPVDFKLIHAVWAGSSIVAPKGTLLHGHVVSVALKPVAVEVAVDPLPVQNVPVSFTGNPLASRKGKLVSTPDPAPKELEYHFRLNAKETAELAGVGLVALPFVALASPFILYSVLHGDAMKPDQPITAGHRAVLRTTAAAQFPANTLAEEKTEYSGQPLIYLVDRLYQKNGKIACGADPLLGPKHPSTSVMRVAPRSYTFIADRKEDTQATVDAKPDSRYLVFHDRAGLHTVGLSGRPDLIERLPKIEDKTVFLYDITKMGPGDQAGIDRDLARGGCGLAKQLHTRAPRVEEPAKP